MKTKTTTRIDRELRQRWEKKFGYSSLAWLMETAMTTILDDAEGQPDLEDRVRAAIRNHVLKYQFNKPGGAHVNQTATNP